jgi:hypothetical protein
MTARSFDARSNAPWSSEWWVAGVLAWPGRHSYAVGRWLPVRYEEGPVGGSASYWMTAEVTSLFRKAKNN